jgi:hypothetical protein
MIFNDKKTAFPAMEEGHSFFIYVYSLLGKGRVPMPQGPFPLISSEVKWLDFILPGITF